MTDTMGFQSFDVVPIVQIHGVWCTKHSFALMHPDAIANTLIFLLYFLMHQGVVLAIYVYVDNNRMPRGLLPSHMLKIVSLLNFKASQFF